MNKKVFVNPANPYHRVTVADLASARLYKSLGWREVQAQVTVQPKAEAKK